MAANWRLERSQLTSVRGMKLMKGEITRTAGAKKIEGGDEARCAQDTLIQFHSPLKTMAEEDSVLQASLARVLRQSDVWSPSEDDVPFVVTEFTPARELRKPKRDPKKVVYDASIRYPRQFFDAVKLDVPARHPVSFFRGSVTVKCQIAIWNRATQHCVCTFLSQPASWVRTKEGREEREKAQAKANKLKLQKLQKLNFKMTTA